MQTNSRYITQESFGGRGSTRCLRCNRPLSNPTSIQAGKGPVCRHRNGGGSDKTNSEAFTDRALDIPLAEGIVLRRVASGGRSITGEPMYEVATNVPHLVTHHSPTGFEFGYGGSGPADLALNIVQLILNRMGHVGERTKCWDGECWTDAYLLHQAFKREFVAGVDRDGAVIPWADAEAWVRRALAGWGRDALDDPPRPGPAPRLWADLPDGSPDDEDGLSDYAASKLRRRLA